MWPEWALKLPWNIIYQECKQHRIDPLLTAAVIQTESAGQTWATRYEPRFKWILRPDYFSRQLGITEATEETHQKTSWGLMQVMGSVARELGHRGYLPELCKVNVGIRYGVRKLGDLHDQHGGDYNKMISAYNAGTPTTNNVVYVNKVMDFYEQLKQGV